MCDYLQSQHTLVYCQAVRAENIENDTLNSCIVCEILFYRCNSNLCGFLFWEMKLTGGYTTERYAFASAFSRQFKAGTIARSKQFTVLFRQRPGDDRANGMKNILAGQIEGRSDFCLSRRLVIPLPIHNIIAEKS